MFIPTFIIANQKVIQKFFVLLILYSSFSLKIHSQIYPYNNFSVREGLVNSNVYSFTHDRYGFIWFATENGLSKFDGVEFVNYTLGDLGITSSILSISTDHFGNIIFGNSMNGIYRFNQQVGKAEKINTQPVSPSNDLIIESDIIWSLSEYHTIEGVSVLTGEVRVVGANFSMHEKFTPLCMTQLRNGRILVGMPSGVYEISDFKLIRVNISNATDFPVYSIFEDSEGVLWIGSEKKILKIRDQRVSAEILIPLTTETRVRNVNVDDRGQIWFNPWGTREVFTISNGSIINISEITIGLNSSVSRVRADKNGNIWLGTLGKGAYLFSNMFIINYPVSRDFPNANIKKIIHTQKGILIGTSDGVAYLDTLSARITFTKHMPDMTQFVRDVCKINDREYIFSVTDIRLINPLEKSYKFSNENLIIRYSHSSSLYLDNDELIAGNWDNMMFRFRLPGYTKLEKAGPLLPDFDYKLRISCFSRDAYSNLWIGSQQGFCVLNNQGFKRFFSNEWSNDEVFGFINDGNDRMMVISKSGLTVYHYEENVNAIRDIEHIGISNTTCMAKTGADEYLFGTSDGLIYMHKGEILRLTIHDGMLSNQINDVEYNGHDIYAWVATAEGLMKIDLEALRLGFNKKPAIDFISVNKGDMNAVISNVPINFSYLENSFSIKFNAFHYPNPKALTYQYNTNDDTWIPVPGNEIQFASMAPGLHRISVRAGYNNSWGPATMVSVFIEPPYYRTWWFYSLMICLTMVLIFVFYRGQARLYRKKQDEKLAHRQKLSDLQQKALAGNLNPHFVFNSLNSIQHFINSNSAANANDYLAKFSRLMRMHLNMAEKSFIALNVEVSRLEHYLSLEQMRFGEKLSWEIIVAPGIDPYRTEIPNMIIQPFIENAIWHGIMPSTLKGQITMLVDKTAEGNMVIRINDNGVGMNRVPAKSKLHESKGVRLIRERLDLMDPKAVNTVVYENLTPGTSVILTLTAKMYHEMLLEAPFPQ